ncbi:hypothetical protein ElyMa_005772600 [Elysia marginata]|uniref:Uncharacterized protein n=1 Tax=Elysia marginata TaxID=1093978 RepID=A0AAV4FP14_9GAST|nr:hypothetical protein ElyMa_005772600 [Elysia marginata]
MYYQGIVESIPVSAKTIAKESRCTRSSRKSSHSSPTLNGQLQQTQTFVSTTPENINWLFNKTVYSGVIDWFPRRNFVSISYKRFIKVILAVQR